MLNIIALHVSNYDPTSLNPFVTGYRCTEKFCQLDDYKSLSFLKKKYVAPTIHKKISIQLVSICWWFVLTCGCFYRPATAAEELALLTDWGLNFPNCFLRSEA